MKSLFINELKSGDALDKEAFMLQDVMRRKTRDGRSYLLGNLRDKTGQVAFIFWDVPDYIEAQVRPGGILLVTGSVTVYKESLQVNATDFAFATDPDMSNFMPSSNRSSDEMVAELKELINGLAEPWQGLMTHLLLNDDFLSTYATAPAARGMHHAFIGGLLEHTLSMAAIAQMLAEHYPYVNKDLLLSGVLAHDIGKTVEYDIGDGFSFSEDGRLVGHIVRGIVMVENAAAALGTLSPSQLRQLIHLIASHHGTQEWGAPVVPKTLEAVLLHQIDLLDSRVQGFYDHLGNDEGGGPWSVKSSLMFGTDIRYPPGMES